MKSSDNSYFDEILGQSSPINQIYTFSKRNINRDYDMLKTPKGEYLSNTIFLQSNIKSTCISIC